MASGEMKDQWTLLKARYRDLAKSPGLTRAIGFSNRPVVCKSAKIAVPEVVLVVYPLPLGPSSTRHFLYLFLRRILRPSTEA